MPPTAKQLIEQHSRYARSMNPDVFAAYGDNQAATIWAEGGEWPPYHQDAIGAFAKQDVRSMEVEFQNPGPIKSVTNFLTSKFADTSVVGLTFECGAGKSTTVVEALYAAKLGRRVFVVEPSIIVARKLADYMSSKEVVCSCMSSLDAMPSTRALLYTNAGILFMALAMNKVSVQDVVVIDEAHTSSFMTGLLIQALAKFGMPVLQMTASTSPNIRGLRGVKLTEVNRMTSEISDAMSKDADRAAMVGVTDSQAYAFPAAALVGATVDIRVVYDTGLRPEPKIHMGQLIEGERRATTPEILQMVGRLGRTGKGGVAYYNRDAPVLNTEGASLYDVLEKAISVATGLSEAKMGSEKAGKIWHRSGILVSTRPIPTPIVTEASPPVGSLASPPLVSALEQQMGSMSMESTLRRSSSVHSERKDRGRSRSPVIQVQDEQRLSSMSRHGSRAGSVERGRRSSSTRSYQSADATLVPTSDDYGEASHKDMKSAALDADRATSPFRTRDRTSSTSSVSSTGSKFHFRHGSRYKRHSSGEVVRTTGSLRVDSCVIDRDTKLVVAQMSPDPEWRPFRRELDLYTGEISSNTGIRNMIDRLDSAHKRGDLVFPAKFPMLDEGVVAFDDRREARNVLGQAMLATYTEGELLAVCALWNAAVDSLKENQPMPSRRLEAFLEYFRGYTAFDRNRA